MMNTFAKVMAICLGTTFAFAALPAQAEPKTEKAATETSEKKKRKRPCPIRRNINGFNVIDRRHLVLSAGTRDYLVTVTNNCYDLPFREKIAIDSRPAGGLCVERNDVIIVGSPIRQRCFIREIVEVENVKEARKIVEERKKKEDE